MPKTYSTDRDLFPEKRNNTTSSSEDKELDGEDLPPLDPEVLIRLVRNHYPVAKGPQFGPYRKRKQSGNDV